MMYSLEFEWLLDFGVWALLICVCNGIPRTSDNLGIYLIVAELKLHIRHLCSSGNIRNLFCQILIDIERLPKRIELPSPLDDFRTDTRH